MAHSELKLASSALAGLGLEKHWHGAMPDDFLKPTDAIMRVSAPCPCAPPAKASVRRRGWAAPIQCDP